MTRFWFKDRMEGWIFLAALTLGVFFLGLLWRQSNGELAKLALTGDAISYFRLAENPTYFFAREIKPLAGASDAFLRTPGYPWFLALLLQLSGGSLVVVFMAQSILAAYSAVLAYRLAGLLRFSPLVQVGTGWLMALEPTLALFRVQVLTEVLFIFLLLLAAYLWLAGVVRDNLGWRRLLLVGFLWGAAILVRPVLYPLTIAAVLWIAIYAYRHGGRRGILKPAASFLVGVYILLFPWLWRNKLLFDSWSVSSIAGVHTFNYAISFYAYEHGINKGMAEDRLLAQAAPQMQGDKYDIRNIPLFRQMAWEIISANWPAYLRFHAANTVTFFIGNGYRNLPRDLGFESAYPAVNLSAVKLAITGRLAVLVEFFRSHPVALIVFLLGAGFWFGLTLFMLYGILTAVFREPAWDKKYFLTLAALTILYFGAVAGTEAYYKMRLPVNAFIFILALYGLDRWLRQFSFYASR